MLDVVTRGFPQAEAALSPERAATHLQAGFLELGREVAAAAQADMAGHRATGAAAASIRVAGPALAGLSSLGAQVVADVAAGALAGGWNGNGGSQPPVEPIAAWLSFRGADPSDAFAVARAIGRRGFSFGRLETFSRAWASVRDRAGAIIAGALRGL